MNTIEKSMVTISKERSIIDFGIAKIESSSLKQSDETFEIKEEDNSR